MKKLLLFLICIFALSCQKKTDDKAVFNKENSNEKINSEIDTITRDSTAQIILNTITIPFTKEFLELNDVEVNNNPILISLETFNKKYPKRDSVKTDVWECGNPLEWLDETWMTETYGKKYEPTGTFENYDGKITSMYINGATFISNKHMVLFDEGCAKQNTFTIKSANIKLNHNTTLAEFQKLFPVLKKETTELKNVVRFRIGSGKNIENSFLFYFKDGKLDRFILWWLLC